MLGRGISVADAIDLCSLSGVRVPGAASTFRVRASMDPATMAYLAGVAHHAELHPDDERGPSDLLGPNLC